MDKDELEKWLKSQFVDQIDDEWLVTTRLLQHLIEQREFIAWQNGWDVATHPAPWGQGG